MALVTLTGCAASAHRSSPWEYGGSIRPAPGFAVGQQGTTVHPVLGYTYLSFDGGRDEIYEYGAQVRRPVTRDANGDTKLWLGVEAALASLKTSGTGYSFNTSGWTLSAMAGVPVLSSRWGVNAYGAAGISDFGGSGINVRFGVDLQPWFLKRSASR
jgi:hypothetical protein